MNCGDKSLYTSNACGMYSCEPSWRDVRSIRALIFTFSFTPRKFWRPSHVIIQGNVTFWIKVFERFEVVIAYFALVNLGWFSKHFISFQKLPTVIFRSHCSTVVYKWNWTMYVCMSENQSAPKLENRKTSPCSPCAPNLLHVLVTGILGYHNLCSPDKSGALVTKF